MDDKLYEIVRQRLDQGSVTIQWLCKHMAATEVLMKEIRCDTHEIKELLINHDTRIGNAEKRIRYVEGKMHVVFAIFIIIVGALIVNATV